MAKWTHIGAITALITLGACAHLDLEEQEELNSQAHQISAQDSVVLCPLVASVEPENSDIISIFWAAYPPNDDRLQLMHARVSADGELLDSQAVAFLDGDLVALQLRNDDTALEVDFVDSESGELRVLHVDSDGEATEEQPGIEAGWSDSTWDTSIGPAHCETSIQVNASELAIFRGQVDGQLSLFVQLNK